MSRISTSQTGKQCAMKTALWSKPEASVGPLWILSICLGGKWTMGNRAKSVGRVCWRRKSSLHTLVNTAVVAGWSPSRKERASQLPDSWGFSVSCLALPCTSVCAWYRRTQGHSGTTVCRLKHTMCRFLEAASNLHPDGTQKLLRRRDTLLWLENKSDSQPGSNLSCVWIVGAWDARARLILRKQKSCAAERLLASPLSSKTLCSLSLLNSVLR